MRTPVRPQNPIRKPLNRVLTTEANVRLLRELALAGHPIAAGELAKRANLGRTSIYPALASLESEHIVEFTGIGAQRQAQFRAEHPLAQALQDLFRAEAKRVDDLVSALRDMFRGITLQPIAAWLEGLSDVDAGNGGKLAVWVVADPKYVSAIVSSLHDDVMEIQERLAVYIALNGIGRSELEVRARKQMQNLREATVLSGVPPQALLAPTKRPLKASKSHAAHDATARRLAVAVAAKLKWDPSLIQLALGHVRQRLVRASAGERRELQEWVSILSTLPAAQVRRLLVDTDERAIQLRQTLPALGLLTPAERESVVAATSDDEARAVVLGR